MVSLVGGDEVGEDGDGSDCPEGDGDPGELEETVVGVVYLCLQEGDFLVERDLLAVHFVGVGDELGDGFLVFLLRAVSHLVDGHLSLAGLLEERERGFNLCYLAFVLDDTPHGVGDVLSSVLVLFFEAVAPVVESEAEVAGPALQGCDVVVDAGNVVDDALVVIDDCLDGGVAVLAACCAVALGLGGCHGVCPS